jgi:hypothetical protein
VKRDNADPPDTLEEVQLESGRDVLAEAAGINRPMSEQQIVPRLGHHPWQGRHGPRTMRDLLQNRPIEIVVRHVIPSPGRGDGCAPLPTDE